MNSLLQRVLAAHTQAASEVGTDVTLPVARIMAHDGTAPVVVRTLANHGIVDIRAADRAVFVFDHYYPPATEREASLQQVAREFATRHGIPVYAGRGISHQLLPELGLLAPGKVLVGADSHTCSAGAFGMLAIGLGATDVAAVLASGRLWFQIPQTMRVRLVGQHCAPATAHDVALAVMQRVGVRGALGRVLEFVGPSISGLSMPDRFKLANHATEMGAITALIGVDERCMRWLSERGSDLSMAERIPHDPVGLDAELEIDLARVEPAVALPSLPDKVVTVGEATKVGIQQVFLGSCAGGRAEDLREAAAILRGKRVHDGVRLLVAPASAQILSEIVADGTLAALLSAGATLLPPGCGACMGRLGTLAPGDVEVSTQNRNFVGRAGSASSKIYLSSPATAAMAALSGSIGGRNAD